ncbi:MAG TPA: hypothetical protein VHG91_14145 [Longimicrobium sp.]|nr:hypothetical protein [Longimicrobium sp.]
MPGDAIPGEVHEAALLRLLEAFPPGERAAALGRLLDEIERLHREHGAEVPAWVVALRKRASEGGE